MQKDLKIPKKPVAQKIRNELTRLPELHSRRLRYRRKWARRFKWFVRIFTRAAIKDIENFPKTGPALLVFNHLGTMDGILGLAAIPVQPDAIGKVELYDHKLVGKLLHRYGVIWIHRGTADVKAIRCTLEAFRQGRIVAIAPEGRQSVTGALEEATGGAAFLALKAGVPVHPIALTGTGNDYVNRCWRRLRRPEMSIRFGPQVDLDEFSYGKEGVQGATRKIMRALAELLPEGYRGAYTA